MPNQPDKLKWSSSRRKHPQIFISKTLLLPSAAVTSVEGLAGRKSRRIGEFSQRDKPGFAETYRLCCRSFPSDETGPVCPYSRQMESRYSTVGLARTYLLYIETQPTSLLAFSHSISLATSSILNDIKL